MAGTLSAAGEPLQRLPPAEARPWTWVEPIRLTASSTPGQTLPKRGCSASTAPGNGGADAKTAIGGLLDRRHLGDLLDVDDQARPHAAGAHLHQEIGAAGHDARRTSCGCKCANRFIKRLRRQVSDIGHGRPSSPLSGDVSSPCSGLRYGAYTDKADWNSRLGPVEAAGSHAPGGLASRIGAQAGEPTHPANKTTPGKYRVFEKIRVERRSARPRGGRLSGECAILQSIIVL